MCRAVELSADLVLHPLQVAGHAESIFTCPEGENCDAPCGRKLLYKRWQAAGRGARERGFYGSAAAAAAGSLLPAFAGVATRQEERFLALEDVTAVYSAPCVVDCKLGRRSWYDGARKTWVEKCAAKDEACRSREVGFRLCGAVVCEASDAAGGSEVSERLGKEWGKQAGARGRAGVAEALAEVLRCSSGRRRIREGGAGCQGGDIVEELLSGGLRERLAALEAWCTGAGKRCRINSASVLILFEGDAKAAEANGGRRPELKLIDFAHSFVEGATRPRRAARAATLSDPAKRGARAPFGLVRSCSAQFAPPSPLFPPLSLNECATVDAITLAALCRTSVDP